MAKKDPELQLFLLKQAEKKAKAARFDAWLALQQQYAANKAADIARKAAKLPTKKKASATEQGDAHIAEQTRLYHEKHNLPWPPEVIRAERTEAADVTGEGIQANNAESWARIKAQRDAWLAAQRGEDPSQ